MKPRTEADNRLLFRAGLLLLVFMVTCSCGAASVTLAWSPAPRAAGYRLYQGGASRAYTNAVEVGAQTTCTVSNLAEGATYYFAVTDYWASGLESDYSNEVSYWVGPATPRLQAHEVLVRQPVAWQVSTNLQAWAACATNYAWMVRPATNAGGFYRVMILPLLIEEAP